MGKFVEWIRSSRDAGLIQKVTVLTLMLFLSIFLIGSIVLSPFFFYGFKEFIRQDERSHYEKWEKHLIEVATQHARHEFLRGRATPLTNETFTFKPLTRKRVLHDLELKPEEAKEKSDLELLRMAAAKYDNYIDRYEINYYSQGSFLSRIFPFNYLVN